jgi:hypothetical protein
MVDNAETARERAIAGRQATSPSATTNNNYGAFSELPLYKYSQGPGSSQQEPTTPTGPTITSTFYTGVGANRKKVDVYSDGTTKETAAPETVTGTKTVVSTYTDPTTGDVFSVFSDGTKSKLATGGQDQAKRQSAYDVLLDQFSKYGLESLVTPLKDLITTSTSPSEFAMRLRETESYKKRFAGNAARIAKGLTALDEGDYIKLEDKYQTIMRNYGLPASYYSKDNLGRQEGFEKLIAGDVSPTELEDRVMIAQKRVIDAAPQVKEALRQFYPDIKDGDILAYTLDPAKGLDEIKRKVTAAEIGGAAMGQGLGASALRAEELARSGVDAARAKEVYGAIGGGLQRGSQLASIYGEDPYTQATAEEELFKLSGQTEAGKERKKIIGLEKATFGGQTGTTTGALARDRAGSF